MTVVGRYGCERFAHSDVVQSTGDLFTGRSWSRCPSDPPHVPGINWWS